MDMLRYKEMWWQAERDGSQVTFLHRLYEALEEGQERLFLTKTRLQALLVVLEVTSLKRAAGQLRDKLGPSIPTER